MSSVGFEPEGLTQADCDALHFEKNTPPKPTINGRELKFPPYKYMRFPCAMYHATDKESPKLVHREEDERNLRSRGWADSPDEALELAKQREADRAVDAAVRAYDDLKMSDKAKAEVAQLEQETNDFVVEVPEKKRRRSRAEGSDA